MLLNEVKIVHACAGQKTKRIGHLDVDHVVWDGEKEIQPIIQSYAESSKIENIIKRIALGDTSALVGGRGEGIYVDKDTYESMVKINNTPNLKGTIDQSFKNLYNGFAGKDNITYAEFVSIIKSGNLETLNSYLPTEEPHE